MITLTIDGKEYECPDSYSDITLGRFKEIQDWMYNEYNSEILEKIISSEVDDEERALNFYLDLINYVTEIPKKILMQVKPYGDSTVNELSIQWVFETLSFLLCVPIIEEPDVAETLNGYHFIDRIDLNQAILRDLDFIEYQEAKGVQKAFNNLKDDARFEYLNLLLAIMYRPKITTGKWLWKKEVIEQYDSERVKARAKEFDNVTMDRVWNCLFFFTQLKTKSLKDIEQSFQKEVAKAHKLMD